MIVLIDNYDSFVHNLGRYFQRLGQQTLVIRNDAMSVDELQSLKPTAIVISPGPCTPNEAGISLKVVEQLSGRIPILGVCLGHQAIGQVFGGSVVRHDPPVHGESSLVNHSGSALFADVPTPFSAARYHSLVVDHKSLPSCLEVTASLGDGTVMALRHKSHSTFGLQFHPESILTESGFQILCNFLQLAGQAIPNKTPRPEWQFCEASDPTLNSTSNAPGYPYHAFHQ